MKIGAAWRFFQSELGTVGYVFSVLGLAVVYVTGLAVAVSDTETYWHTLNVGPLGLVGYGGREVVAASVVSSMAHLALAWLTSMRLRHAGLLPVAALLVFVPKVVFLLLVWALFVPEKGRQSPANSGPRRWFTWKSAGILISLLLAAVGFGTLVTVNGDYGWNLFVLLPFGLGFVPAIAFTFEEHKTLMQCSCYAFITLGLAMITLVAIGVEGMICIAMALPLIALPVFTGAAVAYLLQPHAEPMDLNSPILSSVLGIPLLLLLGSQAGTQDNALRSVSTSIEIDAPPTVVWQNVVAFNELDPPGEMLFRAGIAYPKRAEIKGTGVGAVRHCVFSTGSFVEPITVWDEPHKLAFDVVKNPPTMDELSPYKIRPKHLDGYFVSERGQFLLIELEDGRTRIEGTTWYRQSFGPSAYWGLWSDHIIHKIHGRVLEHIKKNAED